MSKWDAVKLSDVCDFQGGTQPPKEEWLSEYKDGYIRMLQIRDFTQERIGKEEYVKNDTRLKKCEDTDILIGRYGASIGKILTGLSGAYNVAIIKTIPDDRKITKRYLRYFLLSPSFQNFIQSVGSRAAQAGFNRNDLEGVNMPLPPLDVQQKIAATLDAAAELIALRKRQLAELDELIKSVFYQMFGDPVVNEKGWKTDNFGEHLLEINSGWSPKCESYPAEIGSWGVLKLSAITSGIYNDNENKKLPEVITADKSIEVMSDDLLFTRKNTLELVGSCAYVFETQGKRMISDLIFRLVTKKGLNKLYLWKLLNHNGFAKNIQSIASGSAGSMPNISKGRLLYLKVPIPPIQLQEEFALIIKQIEVQKKQVKKAIAESQNLFDSLMSQYFEQ